MRFSTSLAWPALVVNDSNVQVSEGKVRQSPCSTGMMIVMMMIMMMVSREGVELKQGRGKETERDRPCYRDLRDMKYLGWQLGGRLACMAHHDTVQ